MINRKKTILGILVLSLMGCQGENQPNSLSPSPTEPSLPGITSVEPSLPNFPSEEPSLPFVPSLEMPPSTEPSIPPSTPILSKKKTILQLRSMSQELTNLTDGFASSSEEVEIKGKVLARYDLGTQKVKGSNQYQILIADETGYCYVNVPQNVYKTLENKLQTSFSFVGKPCVYNEEPSLLYTSHTSCEEVTIDYRSLCQEKTISEIQESNLTLPINVKGNTISHLVSFQGKYLGTMDGNKVLLFSDGKEVIKIHTYDKAKNSLTVDSSYIIYGAQTMFHYAPGIEYIASESCDFSYENYDNSRTLTGENLYKYSYKADVSYNKKYPDYSTNYRYIYHFDGYVNYYEKSGDYYFVLTDKLLASSIGTKENNNKNKALVLANLSCENLTEYEAQNYCPVFDYWNENKPISVDVVLYDWITDGAFYRVYLLENSLTK